MYWGFLIGLVTLCVTACSPKPREISGNVFVVTAGRESKKLGLVPVQIYTQESITKAVDKTTNSLIPELGSLNQKIKAYEAEIQKGSEALRKMDEELEDLGSELVSSMRRKPKDPRYEETPDTSVFMSTTTIGGGANIENKVLKSDPVAVYRIMSENWQKENDALNADYKNKKQAFENLEKKLGEKRVEQIAILDRLANFNEEYQETIFSNLSEPIASTKTDGDGVFKLTLPPTGDFIIAASSSRKIIDKTEKYFWLFRLPKELPENEQVSLNNDNLLVSNYSNSVVLLPIPKN